MSERDFRNVINEYRDFVESVEMFRFEEEEGISRLKAGVRLCDGTILWVREVRIRERMEAYSYYWLRPDDAVIVGWDNAPHHREIASFPHHRHIRGNVEASEERDLRDVLAFIKNFMG